MKNIVGIIYIWFENVIVRLVEKVLHLNLSDEQRHTITQFVKFGIIGLSNTLISYLIYLVVLLLFQRFSVLPNVDYLIAQFVGFVLSVLWSFYWNEKCVFGLQKGEKRNVWLALLKTYISYAFTGLFLNGVLSVLWVEILSVPKLYAPIINLLISVPLNFVLNKFWAFRNKS